MNKGPILLRRIGRILFWRYPAVYRGFGILRGRGDCLKQECDVWMGGYPRSANTFAVAAFKLANPAARLGSHFHIPPFIISCLQLQKPGVFVIRAPEDAAISWTIYWKGQTTLEHCLDYYLDFHRVMRPYISELFVAPFDIIVNDFPSVIDGLNRRFGTGYSALPHDGTTVAVCFSRIEGATPYEPDGSLDESIVNRPSRHRAKLKPALLEELRKSPRMLRKLELANELFNEFCQAPSRARLTQPPKPSVVSLPADTEFAK
jgi:hypothetical protein